jgi:hypothetical protein
MPMPSPAQYRAAIKKLWEAKKARDAAKDVGARLDADLMTLRAVEHSFRQIQR